MSEALIEVDFLELNKKKSHDHTLACNVDEVYLEKSRIWVKNSKNKIDSFKI